MLYGVICPGLTGISLLTHTPLKVPNKSETFAENKHDHWIIQIATQFDIE